MVQDGLETPIALEIEGNSDKIVCSLSRNVFGYLERTAHKIITTLQTKLQIQLFADFHPPLFDGTVKPNTRARSTKTKSSMTLHVVLYGPSICFAEVGQFATTCNLFLQHPRHCDRNVPYRNPHCLTPETPETVYTGSMERMFEDEPTAASGVYQNPIDLFADSTAQEALEPTISPAALRTKLYKHQQQALTFMMQRERGWNMNGATQDIWKQQYEPSGKAVYVNTVTGQKQPRPPPDFYGGLLIDAPGLGKSLSVISLILSTKESQALMRNKEVLRATTLLVVPKTRKRTVSI